MRKTIYSYLGYYNVCHLGSEIKNLVKIFRPVCLFLYRNRPVYLAMNMSVSSVIPWQEIKQWQDSGQNNFVVSTFIERLVWWRCCKIATLMILWVALASLFAVMLGYSRVPYALLWTVLFLKYLPGYINKKFPLCVAVGIGRVCIGV
jgi:amino acid transporter